MIDKNPIDDLFKGLAEAEVAPPASVWEGIVAQQSWSDRVLVSLRKYWWVPLLFLSVTGAGIGAVLNDGGKNSTSAAGLSHDRPEEKSAGPATIVSIAADSEDSQALATTDTENTSAIALNGKGQSVFNEDALETRTIRAAGENVVEGVETGRMGGDTDNSDNSAQSTRTNHDHHSSRNDGQERSGPSASEGEPRESESTRIRGEVAGPQPSTKFGLAVYNSKIASKRVVLPQRTVKRPSLRPGGKSNGTAGYIPPGDWWFGGSVAYSILSVDHDGSESGLVEALNQYEEGSHAISLEMLAGRLWRTGFFTSAGIGTESFTTRFDYTDPSGAEQKTTNRYSMFTIPVAMGWQKDLGRFEVGPAVGLQLELGTSRKGYTFVSPLDVDSLSTGQFSIADLDDADVNRRYGSAISGSISMHLGLKMSEFFSIWARPEYASRLSTLSNDPLQLNADRAGLRFGIRYIMPYNH